MCIRDRMKSDQESKNSGASNSKDLLQDAIPDHRLVSQTLVITLTHVFVLWVKNKVSAHIVHAHQ